MQCLVHLQAVDIIKESEQLWRKQCLLVRAVCQREVDSDRRDGLSWKVSPQIRSEHRINIQPVFNKPESL